MILGMNLLTETPLTGGNPAGHGTYYIMHALDLPGFEIEVDGLKLKDAAVI